MRAQPPRRIFAGHLTAFLTMALAIISMSGCAGPSTRRAALGQLNPALMSGQAWDRVRGEYTGPIRSTTERFSFEGLDQMDIRLSLSGYADHPGVLLRMINGYSTSWTRYAEWKGTYTNIPEKRYGTQGWVEASTHAPNQLFLRLLSNGIFGPTPRTMVLTFRPDGAIDVDILAHNGYRGEGQLWRSPNLAGLR